MSAKLESVDKLCETLSQLLTFYDYYKPYRYNCVGYDYDYNEDKTVINITVNMEILHVKYKETGEYRTVHDLLTDKDKQVPKLDFENYKVISRNNQDMLFTVNVDNLGLLDINNKRKTKINSARYQPKVKITKSNLLLYCISPEKKSAYCYYKIDLAENQIALNKGEYIFSVTSLLSAYNLLDKYKEYFTIDENEEKIDKTMLSIIKKYKINSKALTKIELMSNGEFVPTSDYLDEHLLDFLLDAYFRDYPEHDKLYKIDARYCDKFNEKTPLDFTFMDAIDSLCYDLYEQYKKIHSAINYNYTRMVKIEGKKDKQIAKTLNPTTVQNMIDRYFRMQTDNFHDIQSTKDSNTLTISSQARTIYFYDRFDQEEKKRTDDWRKQKIYNKYFVGVLDPTRTRDGPLINKNNELAKCVDIRKNEIYITVTEIKTGDDVELSYEEVILSPLLSSDCYDWRKHKIIKNKNKISVCQYGNYKDYEDISELPKDLYYVRKRENLLSDATSMIPFTNRMVSTRVLLASHFLDQSMPVVGAKPTVVHTPYPKEFYKNNPENVNSDVNGTVIDIKDGMVKVRTSSGGTKVFGNKRYSKTSMSTTNEYIPQVKIGQTIKKGQILVTTNSFKDGEFTTQVPLYIGFGTYQGREHEDGIILTESAAKKFGHLSDFEINEDFSKKFYYAFKRNSLKKSSEYSKVKISVKKGKRIVSKNVSYEDDLEAIRKNNIMDEWCLAKQGSIVTAGTVLFEYYKYDRDEVNLNIKKLIPDDNVYDNDVTRKLEQIKVPYNIRGKGIIKEISLVINKDKDLFYDGYDEETDNYEKPGAFGVNYDENYAAYKYFKRLNSESDNSIAKFTGKEENTWKVSDENNAFELRVTIQYIDEVSSERLGAKLSNFYASKGVNVFLIPDKYAPIDEFGNKLDGWINTGTTYSRQNPGQVDDVKLGLIGLETWKRVVKDGDPNKPKTRKYLDKLYPHGWSWNRLVSDGEKYGYCRIEVEEFEKYYTHDIILDLLKDLGLNTQNTPNGDCKVYLPEFDRWTQFNCTVGITSMMRLHFIQEHKAAITAEKSIETASDNITYRDMDRDGGQKMGQMEQHQGLAHGIYDILDDIAIQDDKVTKKTEYASAMLMLGIQMK